MSAHLTTTSSALNAGKIGNIFEKSLIIFSTAIALLLLFINTYLRLESEYNKALIFNQYLLILLFAALFMILGIRFFNEEKFDRHYPMSFFIIILMLIGIAIFAVKSIFVPFHNPAFGNGVMQEVFMLMMLIITIVGIIPFTILYNQSLQGIHNFSISFILMPASMMLLSLLVFDNLPTVLHLYQFDVHNFSHQLRLAALLACIGMIAGSLIIVIYTQLLKRITIMEMILPILSTILLIAMIIYYMVNAREIFLMLAISFW